MVKFELEEWQVKNLREYFGRNDKTQTEHWAYDVFNKALKEQCNIPDVSVSVAEVRQAFADYFRSEGCSCCQDREAHEKAEQKLAELLQPDQYDDESGFDWCKYATER